MTEPTPAAAKPAASAPAPDEHAKPPQWKRILDAVVEGNSFTITVLAIITAMILGGILAAFTNTTVLHQLANSPGAGLRAAWDDAAGVYVALFQGSIVNPHTVSAMFSQSSMSTAVSNGYLGAVFGPISETCVQATPLLLAGLAVALPYRAGMFNIGGTSQFIGGALTATYLGYGVSMPPVIHVIVCVLGGFAGGAITGWAVGFLKATTGAHEVIVTIMLNYVMQNLLAYLLGSQSLMQRPGRTDLVSPVIASNAQLPHLFGSGLRINAGFPLALACALGVWWLLNRTTMGFEFRAVGMNPAASRVAGMSVQRTWVMVMLIAGGLAGLAGATVVQGTDYSINFQSYGTYGIDAITVALLGRGKPGGVIWAALLFGALHAGSAPMQTNTGTPVQIIQVLQALIVMFVAAPPLIRAIYRLRATRAAGVGEVVSKGLGA